VKIHKPLRILSLLLLLGLVQEVRPAVLGEQKTLILMVNFPDTATPSLTAAQAGDILFREVNNYYKENSYNKISITGVVKGWYVIPTTIKSNYSIVRDLAIQAADADVYFPDYKRLIIIAPMVGQPHPAYAIGDQVVTTADGPVTLSTAWITPPNFGWGTVAHEYGHMLGLPHANFMSCSHTPATTFCYGNEEYGDIYDIMGYNRGHFNAAFKEQLGWFSAANVLNVISNGTYTLKSYETAANDLKTLKIQRGANDYLQLEYRQPLGFDAALPSGKDRLQQPMTDTDVFLGALLHVTAGTRLLDASPADDRRKATLKVGESLVDPDSKSQITIVSKSSAGLKVQVQLGKTDFTGPVTAITSPAAGSVISESVTINATATDPSKVEKVEFYRNGSSTPFATDMTAPYSATFDTTRVKNGAVQIYFLAYDRGGEAWGVSNNLAGSPVVDYTVNNPDSIPPTVSILSPTNGTIFGVNMLNFEVSAMDNAAVERVEFYLDDNPWPMMTLFNEPFSTPMWTMDGYYKLYAVAYDYAGNQTSSAVVNFSVFVDEDKDGLLDRWELMWFGSLNDPRALPDADLDGDGMSNLMESKAGTSPFNIDDRFRVVNQNFVGSDFEITWRAVRGVTYEISSSKDYINWITNTTVKSMGMMDVSWKDTNPSTQKKFYRVRIP
jgi:hypothetical protein